jgi:alpha-glucosidase (family GH31 glycosyl hydrolase)
LFWEFPDDPHGYAIDDQFLLGHALLVAPVLKRGMQQRAVYLPAGADWYDYWTRAKHTGGQFVTADAPLAKIPLFVRAGSIIPTCEPLDYSDQKVVREIILDVYPASKTTGYLYEDDDASFAYESGKYSLTHFSWVNGELNVQRKKTGFESPVKTFTVRT